MTKLVAQTSVDTAILECFDGAEWHLPLWFPKVTRAVLGLPATISDAELQAGLLELLHRGELETGTVEGADFRRRPIVSLGAGCPDLYVRIPEN